MKGKETMDLHKMFSVTMDGTTPLIMNWDNIDWDDTLKEWLLEPGNKKLSTPGDDRSPAWPRGQHDGPFWSPQNGREQYSSDLALTITL